MTAFRKGWYEVSFDSNTRQRSYQYFSSEHTYSAKCLVEPNGACKVQWADVDGPDGPGREGVWRASYKAAEPPAQPEWWSQGVGAACYSPKTPAAHSRAERVPTPQELCLRAGNGSVPSGLSCCKEIHVGIFFDGTNNNKERDRAEKAHSNVVSLWDAHKEDEVDFFRTYIPGVGTPFKEVGEATETSDGKAFAKGSEARIHYAIIQVYNAVAFAATGNPLILDEEALKLCTRQSAGLATFWRLGDDKMVRIFKEIDERLKKAVEGKRPKVTKIHLSVFGFSRGAAKARVFCNWLQRASHMNVGGAEVELKFLGIFDTVASVGLADSSPVGQGLMDWADGNLEIQGVTKTAHYVAANEIRMAFPLSTARTGRAYPPGVDEYAYPGAHSDLGGSYSPGDQGKAIGKARSLVLAQIPLNDMYYAAINADVALDKPTELSPAFKADFRIDPALDKAFRAYATWTTDLEEEVAIRGGRGALESTMAQHTHNYWRWRATVSPDERFNALVSVKNANAQDKIDLADSEKDWRRDVELARKRAATMRPKTRGPRGAHAGYESIATPVQRKLLEVVDSNQPVPQEVHEFYDNYVHDSHASFYMLGPVTTWDRQEMIRLVKAKKAKYDVLVKEQAEARYESFEAQNARQNLIDSYELNTFERRVLAGAPVFELRLKRAKLNDLLAKEAQNKAAGTSLSPAKKKELDESRLTAAEEQRLATADAENDGGFPVMTDADAPDMRDQMSAFSAFSVKTLVGTDTRREPNGHARYRRILDKS